MLLQCKVTFWMIFHENVAKSLVFNRTRNFSLFHRIDAEINVSRAIYGNVLVMILLIMPHGKLRIYNQFLQRYPLVLQQVFFVA
mgnify:FL=1